jgi:hypothetical protein
MSSVHVLAQEGPLDEPTNGIHASGIGRDLTGKLQKYQSIRPSNLWHLKY